MFADRSLEDCLANYKKAIQDGLLKIMSKMGISVLSSYRGGYNFEAVGLSRALVEQYFPGMSSRISGHGPERHPVARCWPCITGPIDEAVVAAAGRRALPLSPQRRAPRLRTAT
ncbi:MAG: glutamate synthase central domain-containing protein [Thalassobaculum sp.]